MSSSVIEVENLNKTFKSIPAVVNIGFKVEKAGCFGFLGPNGAGKTTIMKMIYGKCLRDNNQNSKLKVFGIDPGRNELDIKYKTGVVPQDNNLDEQLDVFTNLWVYAKFYRLPPEEAVTRIKELLTFMELAEKQKAKIKELSGGMKRRLVLARALLNKPRLLILDEPTTGLDPQVRHLIWQKINQLKKQGTTILLTTHYMEEAFQLCDEIFILDFGRKIMSGRPAVLLEQHIEKYVLIIFDKNNFQAAEKTAEHNNLRQEESNDGLRLYGNSLEQLKAFARKLNMYEYYLRQSNLEDLFLKITGRNINELQ
ncbi:MAG TPA: ABC transporter ATP-binding protein [Spirochaetota bacterium]|nr:ABC transporter ATP-binding protein [Spirochaetota bacterium]